MGRRGSASIRVLPTALSIRFTFEGARKEITLTVKGKAMAPTKANQLYANRLAAEVQNRIDQGTFSMAEFFPEHAGVAQPGVGPVTVASQLDTYIGSLRIEESTKAGYMSAVRFWKAAPCDKKGTPLGTLTLRSTKLSHVLTAIASRPNLTGKTINNYVDVLRDAFALAVADDLLQENVVAEVKRAKHQKPPPDPFTPAERDAIIADFAEHYPGQPHNMVDFWMWSGPRTSEIWGLRWPNVGLAGNEVEISEANVRGKQKKRTKTNTARLVHLNSRAAAALQRQRPFTQLAGGHVFKDPRYDTSWGDERAFRRSFWEPCLKRLGLRYRRPYQMRHTYATAMLMAGMTPAFCAKQLGHSVEVFLQTYAKWIDGDANEREMRRMEAMISGDFGEIPGASQAQKEKTR